jgi:DNA repair protein RadC
MKKIITAMILISTMLAAQVHTKPTEPHANCCLCACGAKDETKCSAMCIRLQHSKRIIEEPEMNKCTAECKRVHVKETTQNDNNTWFDKLGYREA